MEMCMIKTLGTPGLGVLLVATFGCANGSDSPRPFSGLGGFAPKTAVASDHRFLVDADAADEGTELDECVSNADGGQDCVWDDGMGTHCDYTVAADGMTLESELCTGEWGSYTCVNNGAAIDCTFASADGSECQDQWSPDGDLLATTCEFGGEMPVEDCQTQADGTSVCTMTDGDLTCTSTYDAMGQFVSGECSDGIMRQTCETTGEVVYCALFENEVLLCEDTWTVEGEPVSLGCGEYMETDPGEPPVDDRTVTCEPQADGGERCVQTDGDMTCVSVWDASGAAIELTCSTLDGEVLYDCDTDPGDGLLHCVYESGGETCEEIVDPTTGELLSTTCSAEESVATP
jgi:hypothetical protein